MRFDDGASAVCEHSRSLEFSREEHFVFSGLGLGWRWSMNCISNFISSISSSDCWWSLHLSLHCIAWPSNCIPVLNTVCFYELKSSNNITAKELCTFSISSHQTGSIWLVASCHFHFSNLKSSFVNAINNLSSVSIYIGFNHCKCSLLSLSKMLSCENISIVHQFKLARVNCNGGTDVEFWVLELSGMRSLQEHSFVFQVELNIKLKMCYALPSQLCCP